MLRTVYTTLLLASLTACGSANGTKSASETPAEPSKTKSAANTSESLPDPIAKIGDESISLADYKKEASAAIVAAEIKVYEAKKQALDKLG